MSMIGGKTGDQPSGTSRSVQSKDILEAYEEFRNYVRKVSLDFEPKISADDSEVKQSAAKMKVDPEDYAHAYIACSKVKRILEHPFTEELIKIGKTWQAEFGTDEQEIMDNDIGDALKVFFLSTGKNLLVRKRGHFGIVYYFGWYETKPLIMRNIDLLEFGKTSEGYQIVNTDFNQVRESILEYLDIQ